MTGEKVCRGCSDLLPLDAFPLDARVRDGRGGTCRPCRLARQRAVRATSAGDHERQRVREWRREQRASRPEMREAEKAYGRRHDETARRRHGLTRAEKRAHLDAIGWACEVCAAPFATLASAHVDHSHACCPPGASSSCGECVRGFLCRACNTSLGWLQDDRARLYTLILYLDRYIDSRPD